MFRHRFNNLTYDSPGLIRSGVCTLSAIILLTFGAVSFLPAQEKNDSATEKPKPVTTVDPTILQEYLEIIVKPLTLEELTVEAEGWRDLLKENVQQIADVRIAVKKNQGGGEAIPELTETKAKLVDNLNVVLAEMEAKGGEVTSYRKYVSALSGVGVEVADAATAWTLIRSWLVSEQGGQRWLWNLLKFCLILVSFYFVAGIVSRVVQHAAMRVEGFSKLLTNFLGTFVKQAIVVIGLIVALSALEVNIGPLLAAVGAAGFIVAFALQDTLSNFASGLLILGYRPFDVGDSIEAGGVSGTVQSVSLFSTHISTPDNKKMIVPNNDIWKGTITNATASQTRRVDLVFGIGYEDDIDKAKDILEFLVRQHERVLDDPVPLIRVHELADSSVNFICRPWVKSEDYWSVYWDLTRSVKDEFDRQGISFPFPQRDVHLYPASASEAKLLAGN